MTPLELFELMDPELLEDGPFLGELRVFIDHLQEQFEASREATREKEEDEAEDASEDFLYAVYDQRFELSSRPKRKWYVPDTRLGDRTGSRRLTLKRGVCFHHTAVKGGFGARRSDVAAAKARGFSDLKWDVPPSQDLTADQMARAVALAKRYQSTPYHAIMGPNSVLYLNLPFNFVTWHGNGANNDFLGVAWDANSREEVPRNVLDLQEDGRRILKMLLDQGHPIAEATCHCAWTNKPSDPGAEFIQGVIEPLAKEFDLDIRWDFKAKPSARSMREVVQRAA